MRANVEQSQIFDSRFISTKVASVTMRMTGDLILTNKATGILVFDLNGVDRSLYLPALSEERQYTVANIGTTGSLTVRDSGGTLVVVLPPGYIYLFFATASRWIYLGSFAGTADPTGVTEALRVVTAAGAQTVSATEPGLVINKGVASATPITLPTVASRNGKPVRIVDFGGTTSIANPVTITPAGVEKIMNQTGWELSSPGNLRLCPQPALSGWTLE